MKTITLTNPDSTVRATLTTHATHSRVDATRDKLEATLHLVPENLTFRTLAGGCGYNKLASCLNDLCTQIGIPHDGLHALDRWSEMTSWLLSHTLPLPVPTHSSALRLAGARTVANLLRSEESMNTYRTARQEALLNCSPDDVAWAESLAARTDVTVEECFVRYDPREGGFLSLIYPDYPANPNHTWVAGIHGQSEGSIDWAMSTKPVPADWTDRADALFKTYFWQNLHPFSPVYTYVSPSRMTRKRLTAAHGYK